MRRLLRKGENAHPQEMQDLEARLQAALVPIPPRPEFTQDLQRRLLQENELEVEKAEPPLAQGILWTAAGLLSGAFILALIVRGVIALVNAIRSISTSKRPATLNPML